MHLLQLLSKRHYFVVVVPDDAPNDGHIPAAMEKDDEDNDGHDDDDDYDYDDDDDEDNDDE